MMNSNRHVLRSTENRQVLQEIKYDKQVPSNKSKPTNPSYVSLQQQENCFTSYQRRPILTATRSIKRHVQNDENDHEMVFSPMVQNIQQATIVQLEKQSITEEIVPTRQQLEEQLFELPEIRCSILEHLKSVEFSYAPKIDFMEQQSDINSTMRTILVDWLIEVADEYKLQDETLFLCVQYVDRFLSTVDVTRSKLQLLGTTCMYIASKYEEMYPPGLDEFSFITDNTYEIKHILRMEQIVMKMLNFSLSGPTSFTFLQSYLVNLKNIYRDDDNYKSLTMLSNYFCVLSLLQDHPFSKFSASLIATACIFISNRLLNLNTPWTQHHIQMTSYTEEALQPCVSALHGLYSKTYHQDATTSSLLRRYLKLNKDNEIFQRQIKQIIHNSNNTDDNNDEDEILDLTLDDFDEEPMNLSSPNN